MTCILLVNTFNKAAQTMASDVNDFLIKNGHKCLRLDFAGGTTVFPPVNYDCVISLGGDGTVLYAARHCALSGKPVLPVNLGEFGFIAGIQVENWKDSFMQFFLGNLPIAKRSLVEAHVWRAKKCIYSGLALNDAVLTSEGAAKQISVEITAGAISFGEFKADGIIVAASTGSTAYSAAAGGPIVDPSLDSIILNTVSAFSLSNRPLVLPPDIKLNVKLLPSRNAGFVLSYDGQVHTKLQEGDIIKAGLSPKKVQLAGCSSEVFYAALRSKLRWSGGPRA